jgi:hypothetical protein
VGQRPATVRYRPRGAFETNWACCSFFRRGGRARFSLATCRIQFSAMTGTPTAVDRAGQRGRRDASFTLVSSYSEATRCRVRRITRPVSGEAERGRRADRQRLDADPLRLPLPAARRRRRAGSVRRPCASPRTTCRFRHQLCRRRSFEASSKVASVASRIGFQDLNGCDVLARGAAGRRTLGFTTHDGDLWFDGVRHRHRPG